MGSAGARCAAGRRGWGGELQGSRVGLQAGFLQVQRSRFATRSYLLPLPLLQLRYHSTSLAVLPPETLWQRLLRALFGERPRGAPPRSPPRLPAIQEGKPSAPGAAAGGGGAATPPGASPAAASLFAGSPAGSFVDVSASPQRGPAAAEGAWSDVPLGAGTPTLSMPEDWTEVEAEGQERSASASPRQHSPTAAAAAGGAPRQGAGRMSFEQVEEEGPAPGQQ